MMDVSDHHNAEGVIRCFLQRLPPMGAESIIDVGAGRTAPYRGNLKRRCQQYVTLDIRPGPYVDVVADVTEGTDFVDDQFAWAWCSEVLEHIPQNLQTRFASEVLRFAQNAVFTYPTRRHKTFYGDPGHVDVSLDWSQFLDRHHVIDLSFQSGRAVKVAVRRGDLVAVTPRGLAYV